MKKRGQSLMGMSFGTIFSIILIIFIVITAFYTIRYFLSLNKCSEIGFFYDDLQTEINKGWKSTSVYEGNFEGKLGGTGFSRNKIKSVCFGNLSVDLSDSGLQQIHGEIEDSYSGPGRANIFIYPPETACEGDLASNIIYNVDIEKFFCVDLNEGVATVHLNTDTRDTLVTVRKP